MFRVSAALLSACLAFGGHAQANDPSPAFAIPTDATCDEAVAEWDRYQAFVAKNRKTRRLGREGFKSAATADEFNAFGMRCHTLKRFHDSARFFEFATELDSTHALAHYNLACAYARLRQLYTCDADIGDILNRLRKAIELDPNRAKRIPNDADLESVRDYFDMRLLARGAPTCANEMAALFDGVTLWGPTPGLYTVAEITFERTHPEALTGTVGGYAGHDAEGMKELPIQGTWRATADSVIIDWFKRDHPDLDPSKTLTERIQVIHADRTGLSGHASGGWFGTPDECGA